LKKLLLMLAIALFGSGAFAQDFHVGGKLALDVPQFVGVFGRMDFGDRSEPGFGLRVTAGGFYVFVVGVFNVEVNGYYRFARQPNGSGAYVGGGIGGVGAFASTPNGAAISPFYLYLNGLLGYEIQIGDGLQFYAEVRPSFALSNGIGPSVIPFFGLGLLFEF
jgi:hypothetical protein